MGDERTTQSFRVTPAVLTVIITAILSAVGGGTGTAAYIQNNQPTAPANLITRDEFDRRTQLLEKQIDRVEKKLDELLSRPIQTTRR